jgi:predicted transcriptional regulator
MPASAADQGQLRRRADELRDQGLPIAGVAKLLGLTVEAVEVLLASPRLIPGEPQEGAS